MKGVDPVFFNFISMSSCRKNVENLLLGIMISCNSFNLLSISFKVGC